MVASEVQTPWRAPIVLILIAAIIVLALLMSDLDTILRFDDAFMFWRYAVNLRDGFGLAWNPGGEQTYGLTSQLWVYFILPFTYTDLTPGRALQIASFVTGLAGLGLGAMTVARIGARLPFYLVLVVLLLTLGPFAYHMTTGMDTMLSFATNTALIASLHHWLEGRRHGSLCVGLAAFVTVMARPENVIVAFGCTGLAWLLLRPERRLTDLLIPIGLPLMLIAANLVIAAIVFGTPLPLSFYAKSGAAYAGFLNTENPLRYMAHGLPAALPALVLCRAFGRGHGRYLAMMLVPVAISFAYLLTVHQIMGFDGRYYIPFLPFVLLPAAVLTACELGKAQSQRQVALRIGVSAGILLLLSLGIKIALAPVEAAWLAYRLPAAVPQPVPPIHASKPLPPIQTTHVWSAMADLVTQLPPGSVVAASEVGAIGGYAPHVAIIDMAGLNDREIGLHGMSVDRLVARAPALIWLPHNDYTGARSALLSNPAFRQHYRLLVGAFNYGLAIRIDGLRKAAVEQAVSTNWARVYPGYREDDYVADWPTSRLD